MRLHTDHARLNVLGSLPRGGVTGEDLPDYWSPARRSRSCQPLNDSKPDWRYRLNGDPARWLLDDSDNPSVAFWFLRDVVGRPEKSPSLESLREQILFSEPVQELFAAQDESGFWESPTSIDLPRYRATLWSLAFLAELGIPRTSRRARTACEFVLQNHLNEDGAFTGVRELDHVGLLVRSLVYFRYGNDQRLSPALDRLAADAAEGNIYALWSLAELRDSKYAGQVRSGIARVLDALGKNKLTVRGAFPPFELNDELLALWVLALLGAQGDPRFNRVLEEWWERQETGARWRLEKTYDGMLGASPVGKESNSKWATLYLLRVVTR